jgi:hypothetical protein
MIEEDMPATSKAIRRATAIAEHHPSKLYGRNRSLLKMSKEQLHDYASTPEKGLPSYADNVKQAVRRKKR